MSLPRISLCISTYNWPGALHLTLQSVLQQTVLPFEVLIADDGSKDETRMLIERFTATSPIPVQHIWQPDDGFRLAQIRNRAFAAAKGDYIVQVDGDLLLHPQFIADHLRMAVRGTFVCGSRALLDQTHSRSLIDSGTLRYPSLFNSALSKKHNAIHSPLLCRFNYLMQRGFDQYKYVLGCNMAFWRDELLKVNGYNEDFVGWGKEDNDLTVRMMNAGVQLRFIKFGGIVYHLWHGYGALNSVPINQEIFRKTLTNKLTYIEHGMRQYISAP